MVCIEVRGGVVVAAYSDDLNKVMIVDYDDGVAGYLPTEPIEIIPEDALHLIANAT